MSCEYLDKVELCKKYLLLRSRMGWDGLDYCLNYVTNNPAMNFRIYQMLIPQLDCKDVDGGLSRFGWPMAMAIEYFKLLQGKRTKLL